MTDIAQLWIKKLGLKRHPEGGFYREIYRSDEFINKKSLPERYSSYRNYSTSIYYLLAGIEISTFHRIKSDEIWHFYDGAPLFIYILKEDHTLQKVVLGNRIDKNELPQVVIKRGNWFAAEVSRKNSFTLTGCTVAPGFDFDDVEFAKKEEMTRSYPQYAQIFNKLCAD
ncbi:MAG: cupin domain-containing protein [Bacteroidales bacterium]|nr:cupin domain-containing protein [Bacteroidales bacterium]